MKDTQKVLDIVLTASGAGAAGVCGSCVFRNKPPHRPQSLPAGIRAVIAAVFPYFLGEKPGNICLYARGEDYHAVIGRRLSAAVEALLQQYPGYTFIYGCDSSPLNEILISARAGLGVIGQNNLLITPKYGSYVFIGTIATDMPLEETGGDPLPCLSCGACRNACPGQALCSNGFIKERCVSFITQKKQDLTPEEKRLLCASGMVWGCDACQKACPMNQHAAHTSLPEFTNKRISSLPLSLAKQPPEAFEEIARGRAFAWRGTEVLRRNLRVLSEKTGHPKDSDG